MNRLLILILFATAVPGCIRLWPVDASLAPRGRYPSRERATLATDTDEALRAAGYIDIGAISIESPEASTGMTDLLLEAGAARGADRVKVVGSYPVQSSRAIDGACRETKTERELTQAYGYNIETLTTKCVEQDRVNVMLDAHRMAGVLWRRAPATEALGSPWASAPTKYTDLRFDPTSMTVDDLEIACRAGRSLACLKLANGMRARRSLSRQTEFRLPFHYEKLGMQLARTRCEAGDRVPYCRYAADGAFLGIWPKENARALVKTLAGTGCAAGDAEACALTH